VTDEATDLQRRCAWLTALKTTADRLDKSLVRVPLDTDDLLQAVGTGVSMLLTLEMEKLDPHQAPTRTDHPDQMKLWPH
jgi:hypothetical protein